MTRAVIPAAIVLLTLCAYAPVFDNAFVDWDDHTYVVQNDLVRSSESGLDDIFRGVVSHNFHPLTILTMRWNSNECVDCVDGISPRPFLLANVGIHVLNALLVFLLTYRLAGRDAFVGSFCAAVWALHPMHVESVAWISERRTNPRKRSW